KYWNEWARRRPIWAGLSASAHQASGCYPDSVRQIRRTLMTLGKICGLGVVLFFSASLAGAAGLTFTCDQSASGNPDNYAAGTCSYLTNTIAGLYNSRFNNIRANIYIEQGITGLGGSLTPEVYVSYSDYLGALTGTASGDAIDTGALASLRSL